VKRAVSSLVRNGPSSSVRWGWFHLNEGYYERRLGVSTGRSARFHTEAYAHLPEHVPYEPLPYFLIKSTLRHVGKAPEGHTFLDYGSGMGRVVMMAATRPFKRVIGVELMAPLNAIAHENLRRARDLACPVDLVTADATEYCVPDDVSIVHLFNPFTGKIMAKVQDRIRESLHRAPRPMRIVYAHAHDQADLFAGCTWLRRTTSLSTGVMSAMSLHVYEHTPAPS
jgi:predicted RNA methylase